MPNPIEPMAYVLRNFLKNAADPAEKIANILRPAKSLEQVEANPLAQKPMVMPGTKPGPDNEYYVAPRQDGSYSVAKFEGSKEPTSVYTVRPGDPKFACDCWDFQRRGGMCKHQKLVEGYKTLNEGPLTENPIAGPMPGME